MNNVPVLIAKSQSAGHRSAMLGDIWYTNPSIGSKDYLYIMARETDPVTTACGYIHFADGVILHPFTDETENGIKKVLKALSDKQQELKTMIKFREFLTPKRQKIRQLAQQIIKGAHKKDPKLIEDLICQITEMQ